jgi:hypothetical protein
MLFLQAGDFEHSVMGRGRLEGDGHQVRWLGRRMGEVLDISGKVTGVGQVWMFFFLTFQQSQYHLIMYLMKMGTL